MNVNESATDGGDILTKRQQRPNYIDTDTEKVKSNIDK